MMHDDSPSAVSADGKPLSTSRLEYSVVIPVFNERENLDELCTRLVAVMCKLSGNFEIIFVDDGSTDDSFRILESFHARFRFVKVLRFSRNFGHHIAITAGIDRAVGDAVILMDADLQDQPEEIPKLLARFHEGVDVVYGTRAKRRDSLPKRVTSALFVSLLNAATGSRYAMNSAVFRVLSRQVVEELKACREVSRFVIGLICWLGFTQDGVEVEHGSRFAGSTKYNTFKLVRLAFDAIMSFSYAPLRLATYVGCFVATIGLLTGVAVVVRKVFFGIPVMGYASLMVALLLLGSIQLLVVGLVGEYVGRIFTEVQGRPLYVVSKALD
jgi:polyisoprenyl-phosphate glycosyltransferase